MRSGFFLSCIGEPPWQALDGAAAVRRPAHVTGPALTAAFEEAIPQIEQQRVADADQGEGGRHQPGRVLVDADPLLQQVDAEPCKNRCERQQRTPPWRGARWLTSGQARSYSSLLLRRHQSLQLMSQSSLVRREIACDPPVFHGAQQFADARPGRNAERAMTSSPPIGKRGGCSARAGRSGRARLAVGASPERAQAISTRWR